MIGWWVSRFVDFSWIILLRKLKILIITSVVIGFGFRFIQWNFPSSIFCLRLSIQICSWQFVNPPQKAIRERHKIGFKISKNIKDILFWWNQSVKFTKDIISTSIHQSSCRLPFLTFRKSLCRYNLTNVIFPNNNSNDYFWKDVFNHEASTSPEYFPDHRA